jgi:flagellar motor switch/type III secretory pathway protein FliN
MRDASRWAAGHAKAGQFASALTDLLGTRVEFLLRRARPFATARPLEGAIGIRLVPAGGGASSEGALLEVEPALAMAALSLAIRRPVPSVVGPAKDNVTALAGGLAAVVAAAMRRLQGERPLQVATCGPAAALALDFAGGGEALVTIVFTVLVAEEAFIAQAVCSRDRLALAPEATWCREALCSLEATPLAMPVIACASRATVADVDALGPGDVFLPDGWKLECKDDALFGTVFLGPPGAETGIRARLAEGHRLVLGGEVEPLLAAEAGIMAETSGKSEAEGIVGALGDVPVVVRVELGEARMTAREWASVGRGDVLALGRRVGERVVLRVGGVPVARGDLVEIDGEVGVRIVERLHEEPTAA